MIRPPLASVPALYWPRDLIFERGAILTLRSIPWKPRREYDSGLLHFLGRGVAGKKNPARIRDREKVKKKQTKIVSSFQVRWEQPGKSVTRIGK